MEVKRTGLTQEKPTMGEENMQKGRFLTLSDSDLKVMEGTENFPIIICYSDHREMLNL